MVLYDSVALPVVDKTRVRNRHYVERQRRWRSWKLHNVRTFNSLSTALRQEKFQYSKQV